MVWRLGTGSHIRFRNLYFLEFSSGMAIKIKFQEKVNYVHSVHGVAIGMKFKLGEIWSPSYEWQKGIAETMIKDGKAIEVKMDSPTETKKKKKKSSPKK